MFSRLAICFLIPLLLLSCAEPDGDMGMSGAAQAERVMIYRDAWGVPHIHGQSDGDTAFGMAYAQAEDYFKQLEENFIWSTGRAAELYGMDAFMADYVNHALQVGELSRRDYENAAPAVKALLEGYAAGLNYYLETHPEVTPRLITEFEPWYSLAYIRQLYYVGGFLRRLRLTDDERRAAFDAIHNATLNKEASARSFTEELDEIAQSSHGSNSWAANNSKTVGDQTLLFINPHLPAFGMGQVYEAHMISDEGWNFTGYSRFGFPLPYVGFNENLGWASTDNFADQEDAWLEVFDKDDDPLAYRYEGAYRMAQTRDGEIMVRVGEGVEARPVRFLSTHHGSVLAMRDGQYISVRMATFDESGWLDQWHGMSRAQNMGEFKAAASALKMQFGNYTYADRAGNIWQVQNGAIPVRNTDFDWNAPVDGSVAATEWQGYHSLEELPQVLNPVSNWIHETNTTPYLDSDSESDPKPEDYPAYMVRNGDNARGRNARRILHSQESFTYEDWQRSSFDTTVQAWKENREEALATLARNLNSDPRLPEVRDMLAAWDGVSDISSVETTIFVEWRETLFPSGPNPSGEDNIAALVSVLDMLEAGWGDWRVPWGDINRAQRVLGAEIDRPQFCDDCPSLANPGLPGWAGGSHIAWSMRLEGLQKRYALGGNSYTATIAFPADPDAPVQSHSVHVFGARAELDSPHYMDQAALLSQHQYKPAWLYLADVKKGAVQSYHPGQE